MRRRILIIVAVFLFTGIAKAQHASVQEKVILVHEKFTGLLKNDKNKLSQVDNIFTTFYTDQQKLRDDIQKPAGTPGMALGFSRGRDYQSIRKQNEDIASNRDEKLKKLLSGDEYKKWKEEIEPTLRGGNNKR